MKLKVTVCTFLVLVMFSPMLFAAKFRCGLQLTETTFSIPRPPDVWIREPSIQVVIAEAPRSFNKDYEDRIRSDVQQALTPDFIINNNNPETIFRIYIVSYDSDINQYTQTEERRVKVGEDCKTDDKGKKRCTDIYANRNVSVRYWEANAQVNWRVQVTNSYGIVDTVNTGDVYKIKREMSVNGVSQLDSSSLPGEREILNQMVANAAKKLIPRYRKTYDNLKVQLACDDELKPGNELVKDSDKNKRKDWEGALKLWEAATMKKKDADGDRLYNMAVAYEVLAFRAYDTSGVPDDADPLFNKALELYQQAMSLDPKEKYIQRAVERLQTSKNNFRRAKERWAVVAQEAQFAQELAEAEAEAWRIEEEERTQREEARRNHLERPEADDTAGEKVFRTYIRARLGNLEVMDDDEVISAAQGKFKLDEEQALRVFDQEIERLNQVVALETARIERISKYREDFEIFVLDGVIDKGERDVLNAIAENLSMTAEEIKTAESDYVFTDQSASPAAKKSASSK